MKDYTLKNKEGLTLIKEQNEVVDALLNNDFYLNCLQTGLGKTLSTITAAVHKATEEGNEDLHFILLLPVKAIKAFVKVFSKQLGIAYNMYTATGSRTVKGARFHIFNYSTLSKRVSSKKKGGPRVISNHYFNQLKKIYAEHNKLWLIVDEAHSLQDPKTNQYTLVQSIRGIFCGVWFLTATPILNNLEGLFHMVNLLKPGFFKNIYAFKNKYMIMKDSGYYKTVYGKRVFTKVKEVVGYKNLDTLKEKFNEIAIVRSKSYNIEFIYREAKLSDYMKGYYEKAAKGLLSGKKESKKSRGRKGKQENFGPRLHDLQRVVSNSHKDFKALDNDKLTEKERLLIHTVMEILDRGEATLIYFSYLETLERIKYIFTRLQKKFNIANILEVSGNVPQKERKRVEEIISPRSIVLITSAGTESINLQKANNLVFYEIPFPLREFIQAGGRISRMDSTYNKFNIYILEAVGTIDTYKKSRILSNSIAIKTILSGSNVLPTEMLIITAEDKKAMKNELLWCI